MFEFVVQTTTKIQLIRNSTEKRKLFYKFLHLKKFIKQSNNKEGSSLDKTDHKILFSILVTIVFYYLNHLNIYYYLQFWL